MVNEYTFLKIPQSILLYYAQAVLDGPEIMAWVELFDAEQDGLYVLEITIDNEVSETRYQTQQELELAINSYVGAEIDSLDYCAIDFDIILNKQR